MAGSPCWRRRWPQGRERQAGPAPLPAGGPRGAAVEAGRPVLVRHPPADDAHQHQLMARTSGVRTRPDHRRSGPTPARIPGAHVVPDRSPAPHRRTARRPGRSGRQFDPRTGAGQVRPSTLDHRAGTVDAAIVVVQVLPARHRQTCWAITPRRSAAQAAAAVVRMRRVDRVGPGQLLEQVEQLPHPADEVAGRQRRCRRRPSSSAPGPANRPWPTGSWPRRSRDRARGWSAGRGRPRLAQLAPQPDGLGQRLPDPAGRQLRRADSSRRASYTIAEHTPASSAASRPDQMPAAQAFGDQQVGLRPDPRQLPAGVLIARSTSRSVVGRPR